MQVQKPPGAELDKLLCVSNRTAIAFKQPPLYTEQLPSSMDDHPQKLGQPSVTGVARGKIPSSDSPSQKGFSDDKELDVSSKFHFSIGWVLKAPFQGMMWKLNNVCEDQTTHFQVSVNTVKVKVGNGITAVPLTSIVEASRGIIGM